MRNASAWNTSTTGVACGAGCRHVGFLDNLFRRGPRQPDTITGINRIIGRFATATIMGIDREDLGRYPAKQYKVMAFHYGAIAWLANTHGLDETQILGLFVGFIDRYFNMPVSETGSISARLAGFRSNPEERRYLEAGADVFRRWHEHNERRAPLELGRMLQDNRADPDSIFHR